MQTGTQLSFLPGSYPFFFLLVIPFFTSEALFNICNWSFLSGVWFRWVFSNRLYIFVMEGTVNIYIQRCVCSTGRRPHQYLFEEVNEWVSEWTHDGTWYTLYGRYGWKTWLEGKQFMEDPEYPRYQFMVCRRRCRNGTQWDRWYSGPPRRLHGGRLERTLAAWNTLNRVPAVITVITGLLFSLVLTASWYLLTYTLWIHPPLFIHPREKR